MDYFYILAITPPRESMVWFAYLFTNHPQLLKDEAIIQKWRLENYPNLAPQEVPQDFRLVQIGSNMKYSFPVIEAAFTLPFDKMPSDAHEFLAKIVEPLAAGKPREHAVPLECRKLFSPHPPEMFIRKIVRNLQKSILKEQPLPIILCAPKHLLDEIQKALEPIESAQQIPCEIYDQLYPGSPNWAQQFTLLPTELKKRITDEVSQ